MTAIQTDKRKLVFPLDMSVAHTLVQCSCCLPLGLAGSFRLLPEKAVLWYVLVLVAVPTAYSVVEGANNNRLEAERRTLASHTFVYCHSATSCPQPQQPALRLVSFTRLSDDDKEFLPIVEVEQTIKTKAKTADDVLVILRGIIAPLESMSGGGGADGHVYYHVVNASTVVLVVMLKCCAVDASRPIDLVQNMTKPSCRSTLH
jgi:hypothetical protein